MSNITVLNKGLQTFRTTDISLSQAKAMGEKNADRELYLKGEDGNNYIVKDFTEIDIRAKRSKEDPSIIKLDAVSPSEEDKQLPFVAASLIGMGVGGLGVYASGGVKGYANLIGSASTSQMASKLFKGSALIAGIGGGMLLANLAVQSSLSPYRSYTSIDQDNLAIEVNGKKVKVTLEDFDYADSEKHEQLVDAYRDHQFENPNVEKLVNASPTFQVAGVAGLVVGHGLSLMGSPLAIKAGGAIALAGALAVGAGIALAITDTHGESKNQDKLRASMQAADPLNKHLEEVK